MCYTLFMIKEDSFYEQYASMCKTIVNPVRLKVIEIIGDKKMNVSEIQKTMDISMSNLSNHLSALYRVGVLSREKQGNYIYYFLTEHTLMEVLQKMREVVRSITSKRNGIMQR